MRAQAVHLLQVQPPFCTTLLVIMYTGTIVATTLCVLLALIILAYINSLIRNKLLQYLNTPLPSPRHPPPNFVTTHRSGNATTHVHPHLGDYSDYAMPPTTLSPSPLAVAASPAQSSAAQTTWLGGIRESVLPRWSLRLSSWQWWWHGSGESAETLPRYEEGNVSMYHGRGSSSRLVD
jgi:hypothetical protein